MTRLKWIAVPDVHIPFGDHRAISLIVETARALQPDFVFFLGDLLDCYDLSAHTKTKDENRPHLREEIQEAVALLALFRSDHPKAKIFFKEGNHEFRLTRRLANRAPELLGMDAVSWQSWLQLDRLKIPFTGYKEELEPWPGFIVAHGDKVKPKSGYTAMHFMERSICSGISGHTHRLGGPVFKTYRDRITQWTECGHLATPAVHAEYAKYPNWQQGFAVGYHDTETKSTHAWPVPIQDGRQFYPPALERAL